MKCRENDHQQQTTQAATWSTQIRLIDHRRKAKMADIRCNECSRLKVGKWEISERRAEEWRSRVRTRFDDFATWFFGIAGRVESSRIFVQVPSMHSQMENGAKKKWPVRREQHQKRGGSIWRRPNWATSTEKGDAPLFKDLFINRNKRLQTWKQNRINEPTFRTQVARPKKMSKIKVVEKYEKKRYKNQVRSWKRKLLRKVIA